MASVYEKIKTLCDERELTGYRLCKNAGMSPGILTDLKMGRQKTLSPKHASAVAAVLSVPIDFFFETGPFQNWDEMSRDLHGVFAALPDSGRELLAQLWSADELDPVHPERAHLTEVVSFLGAYAQKVFRSEQGQWVVEPRPVGGDRIKNQPAVDTHDELSDTKKALIDYVQNCSEKAASRLLAIVQIALADDE